MNETVFAADMSFYKVFIIFVTGALLGDLVETVFCYIKFRKVMCRSSFVYGHLSAVWGLAFAMATPMAVKLEDHNVLSVFLAGTILGSLFEYVCSAVLEHVVGARFWDYSKFKYNIAGRINLKYSFYWGIAAVIWILGVYPVVDRVLARVPEAAGIQICKGLLIFLVLDAGLSLLALKRYNTRKEGQPAKNWLCRYLDKNFPDEYMENRYPHMKTCKPELEREFQHISTKCL